MKFECPKHADKQARTHTLTIHSTTKSFENPEGAISKSAKEKRMIILLRVNLGAFCDYGYLFGAVRYSQRQNERKYRSLLGYENTCRPQIISRSLSPKHSFIGSILTSPALLLHNHFSFTCSVLPSHLLSRWVIWGKRFSICVWPVVCVLSVRITSGTCSVSYFHRKTAVTHNTSELKSVL